MTGKHSSAGLPRTLFWGKTLRRGGKGGGGGAACLPPTVGCQGGVTSQGGQGPGKPSQLLKAAHPQHDLWSGLPALAGRSLGEADNCHLLSCWPGEHRHVLGPLSSRCRGHGQPSAGHGLPA